MPTHKKDKNKKHPKKKIRIEPHPAVFVMLSHDGKPQGTLKLTTEELVGNLSSPLQ